MYDVNREAPYTALHDYAVEKLPSMFFAEKALDALAGKLNKCRVQSPAQLRQWGRTQIDRLAAQLNKREKEPRSNEKPFVYEQHNGKCFVQLFDADGRQHVWKFPASWLEQARLLWPVYVRYFPDGRPYLARKTPITQPDGARVQTEAVVHRLFLGLGAIRHDAIDSAEAETRDGSWLNFCDDNIRLIKGTDLLDHCSCSLYDRTLTTDWKPAKAKVTTGREDSSKKALNWHEKSVLNFLSGKYPGEQQIVLKN